MAESMKERLERLKNTGSDDYGFSPRRETPQPEKKFLTPESEYMKKVEKAMTSIETLRTKMHSGTDQYISLYQELKKAEEDFLVLLQNPEEKFMDLPHVFVSKVELTKKRLLTKKF